MAFGQRRMIFDKTHVHLGLSDTKVYEPSKRALLGTTAHFCKVVVLELRTVYPRAMIALPPGFGRCCVEAGLSIPRPPKREQIVFSNFLDVYHKSPDSGEIQYKSRT